ncbi:MAG: ABC transporter ATP-binding protein [Sulfurifustaceae bacterium]
MRLTLEHLSHRVGAEPYLYDLDLTLQDGSLNVLLGPTQSGKTSLLRIMAGLDRPTSGRVLIDGSDVTGVSVRRRNVAMVYQQFINYPSLTVYDNIASPLRQKKALGARDIDQKVRSTAQMLRIDHLLERLPAELSGGQQQRTAIARALVKDAELLLLDEPLVNLDYKLREELREELRSLFGSGRTTVVYATTEPQEALILGGHTAVLDAGRVLQFGPALAVHHRPSNMRVAEVYSDPPINFIPLQIDGDSCRISEDARFPRPEHMRGLVSGLYRAGIRAHHVAVGGAAVATVPAIVQLAEISGSETFVHARHGELSLTAQLAGVHDYRLGERVTLHFDPARLFVFDDSGALVAAPRHSALDRKVA